MQAKTPRAVVNKLHAAVAMVTQQQSVRDGFTKAQVPMAVSQSPEEFNAYVRGEVQRWAKSIREHKVTFQQARKCCRSCPRGNGKICGSLATG